MIGMGFDVYLHCMKCNDRSTAATVWVIPRLGGRKEKWPSIDCLRMCSCLRGGKTPVAEVDSVSKF